MEAFNAGTLAGAGSFRCDSCGFAIALHERDPVPECPECGGDSFRRSSLFGDAIRPPERQEVEGAPEWLAEARDALVNLVGEPVGVGEHGHILVRGPTMRCVSDGSAGGSRTAAWCVSPRGGDINCAMVEGGWAARWDRYWRGHRCR